MFLYAGFGKSRAIFTFHAIVKVWVINFLISKLISECFKSMYFVNHFELNKIQKLKIVIFNQTHNIIFHNICMLLYIN